MSGGKSNTYPFFKPLPSPPEITQEQKIRHNALFQLLLAYTTIVLHTTFINPTEHPWPLCVRNSTKKVLGCLKEDPEFIAKQRAELIGDLLWYTIIKEILLEVYADLRKRGTPCENRYHYELVKRVVGSNWFFCYLAMYFQLVIMDLPAIPDALPTFKAGANIVEMKMGLFSVDTYEDKEGLKLWAIKICRPIIVEVVKRLHEVETDCAPKSPDPDATNEEPTKTE